LEYGWRCDWRRSLSLGAEYFGLRSLNVNSIEFVRKPMRERKDAGDDMKPEYDFSKGIRGKYVQRLAKGANVVVLDRDVAKIFPTSKAVNDALRVLAKAGKRHGKAKTRRTAT